MKKQIAIKVHESAFFNISASAESLLMNYIYI